MPGLTEEQKTEITGIITSSLQAANDKAASDKSSKDDSDNGKNDGNNANNSKSISEQIREEIEATKSKSLVDQAKDAVNSDKEKEQSLNKIGESVRFNLSINDFVEKNKHLLPEEASKIIPAAEGKTFKDDNEKANTIRKTFLDSF